GGSCIARSRPDSSLRLFYLEYAMPDLPYDVGSRTYTGYLANGAKGKPAPGIIVIHGGGGLGPEAKKRADMLADLGYAAFAPDLFDEPVKGVDHAKQIVKRFTDDWAELRLRCKAALDLLNKQPNVDPNRNAAIGFCFGGQAALEFARSGVNLGAV